MKDQSMTEDMFDIPAPTASPAIDKLNALLEEAQGYAALIRDLEDNLKEQKGLLNDLKINRIPEAMIEAQTAEHRPIGKNYRVTIKNFVSGSLPKDPDAKAKAIKILESIPGGVELIKTDVSLSFGRSEHNVALNLIAKLEKAKYQPVVTSGVHAATLVAFGREALEKGMKVPFSDLGLFVGKTADIEQIKEKAVKVGRAPKGAGK